MTAAARRAPAAVTLCFAPGGYAAISALPRSVCPLAFERFLFASPSFNFESSCYFIPGPIAALLFLFLGASLINPAFSIALLLGAIFGLIFRTGTKYRRGQTRSISDRLSATQLIDLRPASDDHPFVDSKSSDP